MEYSSSSSQDSKPRRSPPPLVHDATRRASLAGLQRLVYNSQIFSVPSSEASPTRSAFSDAETDNDAAAESGKVSSKVILLIK